MHSEELLRKKIEDARFSLRLYEIYNRKMPEDKLVSEICEKYRRLISRLFNQYYEQFGDDVAENVADSELEK